MKCSGNIRLKEFYIYFKSLKRFQYSTFRGWGEGLVEPYIHHVQDFFYAFDIEYLKSLRVNFLITRKQKQKQMFVPSGEKK